MRRTGSPGQKPPPTKAELVRGKRRVRFLKANRPMRDRVRRLYAQPGWSLQRVADAVGLSEYTIWRIVHTPEDDTPE